MIILKLIFKNGIDKDMKKKNEILGSPSFSTRLNAMYSKLRNSEKKFGDYILENRERVIHLSIKEVAEKSNCSESTIVRFCKALEYRGFQDFKIHLASELWEPISQIHESIDRNDDEITIKKKVFDSHIFTLQETLQVLDNNSFLKAVHLLSHAKIIEFYGTGGSGVVAKDAQHKFLKIGKKCFAYNDIDLQAMSACLMRKGDVAVGISHSGGNKEVLYALSIAHEAGASIISITNYGKSTITKISDVVLFTSSRETAFKSDAMSSRVAELAILDALWVAIALQEYEGSYQNILKTRGATSPNKL